MESNAEIEAAKQAARREFRRQKILNNTNNRLGKITGHIVEEQPAEIIAEPFRQQVENDYMPSLPTQPKVDDEAPPVNQQIPTENHFLTHKYHIILMSFITFIVFITKNHNILQSNIFMPILTYKLLEAFTFNKSPATASSSSNIALSFLNAFCRSSQNRLLAFVPNILNYTVNLLGDITLYTFVFVNFYIFHALLLKSTEQINEILMQT